jgi:hypothetical protein
MNVNPVRDAELCGAELRLLGEQGAQVDAVPTTP